MSSCVRCGKKLTGRQTKFCSTSCKVSDHVDIRRRKLKLKAVAYKGGRCEGCGYNKCIDALTFHHLVPSRKDFPIPNMYRYNWEEKVVPELDKCVLLCMNCHMERHYDGGVR